MNNRINIKVTDCDKVNVLSEYKNYLDSGGRESPEAYIDYEIKSGRMKIINNRQIVWGNK